MSQAPTPAPAPSPVPREMRGYIARNSKRTTDSQPHWRGKVTINGKEYALSLWEKDGNPDLMNLSVSDPATLPPRNTGAAPASAGSAGAPAGSGDNNDIFGDIFGTAGH